MSFLPAEKLAEAQRRFATLQNELQSSLDAQRESNAPSGLRRRKTVFHLSQEERCKHHNIKDLKLAFSEFYLSLILLQNYQVSVCQYFLINSRKKNAVQINFSGGVLKMTPNLVKKNKKKFEWSNVVAISSFGAASPLQTLDDLLRNGPLKTLNYIFTGECLAISLCPQLLDYTAGQ